MLLAFLAGQKQKQTSQTKKQQQYIFIRGNLCSAFIRGTTAPRNYADIYADKRGKENKQKIKTIVTKTKEKSAKGGKDEDIEKSELNEEETARHLDLVKDILENTQTNIKKALSLLKDKDVDTKALLDSLKKTKEVSSGFVSTDNGNERIIEGVFNGEKMISGDGIEYNVPANYASKSKLVEGDILKLTITKDGSFIYKQIGPVERKQLVATLTQDESIGEWYAVENSQRWKLLTASVTYFHGSPGDEVVILLPKDGETKWAAVENVIKGNNS